MLLRNLEKADFCCGEPLATTEQINEDFAATSNLASEEDFSPLVIRKNLIAELLGVSKTSKIILSIILFLSLTVIGSLFILGLTTQVLVLLLVFVQPILLTYFVYWRSRRQYASLDFVIKLFTCGFFFSTTQSFFFEGFLQLFLNIISNIAFHYLGVKPSDTNPTGTADTSAEALRFATSFATSHSPYLHVNDSGHFYGLATVESSPSNGTLPSPETVQDNIILFAMYFFFNAFIIAASVEETMKYFVVKCCTFPAELREPDAVLVYLMMGALGFATAENVEYVFGTKKSPFPGTSLLVGELFVLGIRILMPIHVICSVLQACRLSKVRNTNPLLRGVLISNAMVLYILRTFWG